jgi:anaerobic selenocysteine-containing dehydrogenase
MKINDKKLTELIALNRRNFIKLVVGGAVGINLTPLPWKLMDDVAIWTQNFPWLTVPPVGEFNQVKSVCRLCPGGCGIEIRRVDDRAVKIEGRTDYPVNPGGICPIGVGGLQLLYNENVRYTGPMKRSGPRGSGQYTPISWEEALGLVHNRLAALRNEGRPEALAAVDGNGGKTTMSLLIRRFLQAFGSPNYLTTPDVEDTYRTANGLLMGRPAPPAYDLENADYILSFGCGLIEGWGSPGRMINAWSRWKGELKGKVKVVQLEARASNTASKADMWLAPKPGTETALALGLIHVIIKEGLYDRSFIKNYSFGFEPWEYGDKQYQGFKHLVLQKYGPQQVSSITGLNDQQIVDLAREFAKAKAPIALCGKGKGDQNGSLLEFMAVQCLNALVGNINKPGGVLLGEDPPLSQLPAVTQDGIAKAGLARDRIDQAGSPEYPFCQSIPVNFAEAILEGEEPPVDTLLVFSANPAYCQPNGGRFMRALESIPFIVSFSPFKDETSLMADLVLPDHSYLEKTDDIIWPSGLQYPLYGLTQPVIEPLYNTANCGDTLISLARKLGGSVQASFPWKNYKAVLKERVKGLFEAGGTVSYDESNPVWKGLSKAGKVSPGYKSFNDMWKKIQSEGMWFRPVHQFGVGSDSFKTFSGKFEFFSTEIEMAFNAQTGKRFGSQVLQQWGLNAAGDENFMPHYEDTVSSNGQYPLQLVPYSMINLSGGRMPNPPYLYKTILDNQLLKRDSFVEINPETAKENKLTPGDLIEIESERGSLRARVNIFEGAMPGMIFMPFGFGHTGYDDYHRNKGVNPNDIIDHGRDPLSGQPAWWGTGVRIKKV